MPILVKIIRWNVLVDSQVWFFFFRKEIILNCLNIYEVFYHHKLSFQNQNTQTNAFKFDSRCACIVHVIMRVLLLICTLVV